MQDKIMRVRGVIPPLITTFDEQGSLDEGRLREVVRFLRDRVDGFFVCGTYGSGPLMSVQERKHVAQVVVEESNGLPVIVHVGASNTQATVELAKHAESVGACAVSSIAPFYYEYSEKQLEEHFLSLISAVRIPVFAYNNPKTSRNPLGPSLIARLAENGLRGIKDSSFDLLCFYEYTRTVRVPGFVFIIGTEALLLPAVQAGAQGCIAGLANALPEEVVELYRLASESASKEAVVTQQRVLVLREIMRRRGAIPTIHAILRLRGVDCGWPRRPFTPLREDEVRALKEELQEKQVVL